MKRRTNYLFTDQTTSFLVQFLRSGSRIQFKKDSLKEERVTEAKKCLTIGQVKSTRVLSSVKFLFCVFEYDEQRRQHEFERVQHEFERVQHEFERVQHEFERVQHEVERARV
jgi:hypothetical protein